jgi:FkbM family methyltransferase
MKNMKIFLLITLAATHTTILFSQLSFKNPDEMLAYVKQYLPENPVILEAGGRFGEDTVRMKSLWPNATMHVFEPLPSSFKTMLDAVSHLSNVHCYPYALTSYCGSTDFYINTGNLGACSINAPVSWNEEEFEKTPIKVPCTTLNKWMRGQAISHIDFMWLDMEGHELHALRHGIDVLKTAKAIYTEVSFMPVRLNSGLYTNLKALLIAHGFSEVWRSTYKEEKYGDALFIKKDLLNQDPSHPQANSQH